jgi:hypothetical protein
MVAARCSVHWKEVLYTVIAEIALIPMRMSLAIGFGGLAFSGDVPCIWPSRSVPRNVG